MTRYQPFNDLPAEGAHVYRVFGPNELLLYIGSSVNVRQRLPQHGRERWFQVIEAVTCERHPTIKAARAAEWAAIRSEVPMCNVAGQDRIAYRRMVRDRLVACGLTPEQADRQMVAA